MGFSLAPLNVDELNCPRFAFGFLAESSSRRITVWVGRVYARIFCEVQQYYIIIHFCSCLMCDMSFSQDFFCWNMILCQKNLTFAMSILTPKAPTSRGWADIYIIRRNCTLWFWLVRTSQTLWIVKNKATGTPHGVYCIQPSLASDGSAARCQEGELYTYTNVGLSALLVSTIRAMRRP